MPRDQFGFGWKPPKKGKNPFLGGGFGTSPLKMPKINFLDYNKTGKKVRVPVPIGTIKKIFLRAKGKCEKCKKPLKGLRPHIHHKDKNPKNNKESNLVLLCPNCHSKQHIKDKPKKNTKKGDYWVNPLTGRKERAPQSFWN